MSLLLLSFFIFVLVDGWCLCWVKPVLVLNQMCYMNALHVWIQSLAHTAAVETSLSEMTWGVLHHHQGRIFLVVKEEWADGWVVEIVHSAIWTWFHGMINGSRGPWLSVIWNPLSMYPFHNTGYLPQLNLLLFPRLLFFSADHICSMEEDDDNNNTCVIAHLWLGCFWDNIYDELLKQTNKKNHRIDPLVLSVIAEINGIISGGFVLHLL